MKSEYMEDMQKAIQMAMQVLQKKVDSEGLLAVL